jgi:DNA-directed RNA polymerase beta subunit
VQLSYPWSLLPSLRWVRRLHATCPQRRMPRTAEFSTLSMLSVIASLTPYSDFNQSPRNMYQCQMAKQTMGTPVQALQHRTDNKLYKLQTPQTPLVRTQR